MYASVIGTDGSDLTDSDNPNYFKPSFADFGRLAPANEVTVNEGATGIAAAGKFLSELDWSPLWVTLENYWRCHRFHLRPWPAGCILVSSSFAKGKEYRRQHLHHPHGAASRLCAASSAAAIYAAGTPPFGSCFIDIGFPAHLQLAGHGHRGRSGGIPARCTETPCGAFENLDPNMLDAARTLGMERTHASSSS